METSGKSRRIGWALLGMTGLGALALLALAALSARAWTVATAGWGRARMDGDAMAPTLAKGETVRIRDLDRPLRVGDLVALRFGNDLLVRRVAALPGAEVRAVGSDENLLEGSSLSLAEQLLVDGRPLFGDAAPCPAPRGDEWPEACVHAGEAGWLAGKGEGRFLWLQRDATVPDGHVWLLADDIDHGLDSRVLGAFSQALIVGFAVPEPGEGAEAWPRMARAL